MMGDIKQKIIKLFAHADSEHKIGNASAAALYRKKANALLRQNKLTKKS